VLSRSAASAAAGGQPLPLQRLVLENGYTLDDSGFSRHTLAQLFSSLPNLQHLYLHLWATEEAEWEDDTGHKAAVAALAPLRYLTSLTSLHLRGPSDPTGEEYSDISGWDEELLSCFPSSLAHLEWHEPHSGDIDQLRVDRLTGLTELRLLTTSCGAFGPLPPAVHGYGGLPHLCKLQPIGFSVSDAWLLEHKEVLCGYGLEGSVEQVPGCLGQLVNLRTLDLCNYVQPAVVQAALVAATQVTQLHLQLPWEQCAAPAATVTATAEEAAAAGDAAEAPDGRQGVRAWLAPVLAMTGLRALTLCVPPTCHFLPVGMGGLSQLTRLHASFSPTTPGITCSWVCAIERLVNLQVLTVPAVTGACCHQWLTGLTKLGVLELVECSLHCETRYDNNVVFNLEAAAAHVRCLIRGTGGAQATGGPIAVPPAAAAAAAAAAVAAASRPSSSSKPPQLQLVCVDAEKYTGRALHDRHKSPLFRHLWRRFSGDMALFAGSLDAFMKCGWQLWPMVSLQGGVLMQVYKLERRCMPSGMQFGGCIGQHGYWGNFSVQ
jgi:hypothetical protein